jgi:hypothetical protein
MAVVWQAVGSVRVCTIPFNTDTCIGRGTKQLSVVPAGRTLVLPKRRAALTRRMTQTA